MKAFLQSLYVAAVFASVPAYATEPRMTALTNFSGEDREPSPSPDGEYVAYLSDRDGNRTNQLWLINLTTGAASPLVDNLMVSSPAAWHPDSQSLVFAAKKQAKYLETLWQVNLDGSGLRQIDTGSENQPHMAPAISPDDQWLAFSRLTAAGGSNWDIFLQNQRTGVQKSIATNSPYREVWPRFTGDGKSLMYFSRADTGGDNDEIYRLSLLSGTHVRLTNASGHDFTPAPSPTPGGPIAFVSNGSGASFLYIMNNDSSDALQVDTGEFQARQPAWSPDGTQLYFTGRPKAGGTADIMMMEVPQHFLTK